MNMQTNTIWQLFCLNKLTQRPQRTGLSSAVLGMSAFMALLLSGCSSSDSSVATTNTGTPDTGTPKDITFMPAAGITVGEDGAYTLTLSQSSETATPGSTPMTSDAQIVFEAGRLNQNEIMLGSTNLEDTTINSIFMINSEGTSVPIQLRNNQLYLNQEIQPGTYELVLKFDDNITEIIEFTIATNEADNKGEATEDESGSGSGGGVNAVMTDEGYMVSPNYYYWSHLEELFSNLQQNDYILIHDDSGTTDTFTYFDDKDDNGEHDDGEHFITITVTAIAETDDNNTDLYTVTITDSTNHEQPIYSKTLTNYNYYSDGYYFYDRKLTSPLQLDEDFKINGFNAQGFQFSFYDYDDSSSYSYLEFITASLHSDDSEINTEIWYIYGDTLNDKTEGAETHDYSYHHYESSTNQLSYLGYPVTNLLQQVLRPPDPVTEQFHLTDEAENEVVMAMTLTYYYRDFDTQPDEVYASFCAQGTWFYGQGKIDDNGNVEIKISNDYYYYDYATGGTDEIAENINTDDSVAVAGWPVYQGILTLQLQVDDDQQVEPALNDGSFIISDGYGYTFSKESSILNEGQKETPLIYKDGYPDYRSSTSETFFLLDEDGQVNLGMTLYYGYDWPCGDDKADWVSMSYYAEDFGYQYQYGDIYWEEADDEDEYDFIAIIEMPQVRILNEPPAVMLEDSGSGDGAGGETAAVADIWHYESTMVEIALGLNLGEAPQLIEGAIWHEGTDDALNFVTNNNDFIGPIEPVSETVHILNDDGEFYKQFTFDYNWQLDDTNPRADYVSVSICQAGEDTWPQYGYTEIKWSDDVGTAKLSIPTNWYYEDGEYTYDSDDYILEFNSSDDDLFTPSIDSIGEVHDDAIMLYEDPIPGEHTDATCQNDWWYYEGGGAGVLRDETIATLDFFDVSGIDNMA